MCKVQAAGEAGGHSWGRQGGSVWSELGLRSGSQEEAACGSPRTQEGVAETLSRGRQVAGGEGVRPCRCSAEGGAPGVRGSQELPLGHRRLHILRSCCMSLVGPPSPQRGPAHGSEHSQWCRGSAARMVPGGWGSWNDLLGTSGLECAEQAQTRRGADPRGPFPEEGHRSGTQRAGPSPACHPLFNGFQLRRAHRPRRRPCWPAGCHSA